jgi:hypothetical protein
MTQATTGAKSTRLLKEEPSMSTKNQELVDFNGRTVSADEYRPTWLQSLADDITLEGSAMDGVATGADAVRSIVTSIRTLYDRQVFNFAGNFGENGFMEDYTAWFGEEPVGNVVLVTRNSAGQAQQIVANYRPRSTLLRLSRLIGEQLAGSPYAEHFATGDV